MSPIVEPTKFAQCRAELGSNFARIVGYFKEDGPKAIAQLEEAVRRRDAAAMVRPAHTLKGESLQFGAERLGLCAEEIEKAARQAVEDHDFPEQVIAHIAQLKPLFCETTGIFDRELFIVPATPRRSMGFGRKAAC